MTGHPRAVTQCCPLTTAQLQTRPAALVALLTGGLALSTIVAATAVSIGLARADVFALRVDADAPLAIALLTGLLLSAMGAAAAALARAPKGEV
ncbi:MAG: hypothetical protein IT536_07145 [Hyphomicrobiales bacterium]|nr:hypothetical protein [Hyphomicrobiales bacterium]